MDVRCERCKTLYELDDARVSEAGTTVRCTTCGHVFRVRKKVFLMTEPVGAGGESTAVPPPVVEKPPWRVRSPSGRVIAFRELTSMQKWIVERKFGRDDEISLHGDTWKRLGDIAELQPFFLLLDDVDRVHELEERLRRTEPPEEAPSMLAQELGAAQPGAPPDAARPTPTPIRLDSPIDTQPIPAAHAADTPRTGPPSAFSLEDIRAATEPSPDDAPMPEDTVEPEAPPEEAERPQFTRRAGLGVDPALADDAESWDPPRSESKLPWVATFLIVAVAGIAGIAYFQIWVPAQEEKLRQEAERARLEAAQKARAADDAEVRERERKAKEELVAGMAARSDAGTASPADGGTGGSAPPEAPRGSPGPGQPPPTSPVRLAGNGRARPSTTPEGRPRTFDDWLSLGDREREHSRARAALDAYDRAIALEPTRAEAYVGQGRALLELGDGRSAVAALRRALQANPRYSVAEFWLGEAYRKAGQNDEAFDAYRRYLDAAPEGAEAARAQEALNELR